MRDLGLEHAIGAVGGVSELARRLGISQPSVSNWQRVPAERVLAVEEATGVARDILRPDLYFAPKQPVDEIDAARSEEYALLATLLARAPDASLLGRLARLVGDESTLGQVHSVLASAAAKTDADTVNREYFELFVGVGRGELLPYGSYYLTGFLHERPLARLRGDMKRMGIEREAEDCEPEDHAATLCAIMGAIVGGSIDVAPDSDRKFFEKHLAPWIGRFFTDLENSSAAFYSRVGTLGRTFTEIEQEAFALSQ